LAAKVCGRNRGFTPILIEGPRSLKDVGLKRSFILVIHMP
jgi:hypothetical protein